MDISVIIPSYKPKEYLWECLNSLTKQTISKDVFEIILILNGCNEPYLSEINEYVKREMFGINIRIIQTDIAGVSNARNIGIDGSQGDYITFIDDDDYVSATYLQEMYDIAKTGVLPLSNILAFADETNMIESYYVSDCYNKNHSRELNNIFQIRSFFSISCSKLIKRNIINSRRYDTQYVNGEDSVFMFLISNHVNKASFTSPDAIYYRRNRPNSAVTKYRSRKDKIILNFKIIKKYVTIYLRKPMEYNFFFALSRVLASSIDIIYNLFKISRV